MSENFTALLSIVGVGMKRRLHPGFLYLPGARSSSSPMVEVVARELNQLKVTFEFQFACWRAQTFIVFHIWMTPRCPKYIPFNILVERANNYNSRKIVPIGKTNVNLCAKIFVKIRSDSHFIISTSLFDLAWNPSRKKVPWSAARLRIFWSRAFR